MDTDKITQENAKAHIIARMQLSDENCITGTRHVAMRAIGPYWNLTVICDQCGYIMQGFARERMLDQR
jgi:hypothetical protein